MIEVLPDGKRVVLDLSGDDARVLVAAPSAEPVRAFYELPGELAQRVRAHAPEAAFEQALRVALEKAEGQDDT